MHSRYRSISLVLFLTVIILLTWANYRYAVQNPGGNDFLVHWIGTRALLVDGLSPYSDEVALRIQEQAYGRPATSGEHELRVAYPLYSMIIFAPYALISNYPLARAFWMTSLEIALVAISLLSIKLTRWKPGVWLLILFFIFSLVWYHGMRPLINGNAVILVTLFLLASIWMVKTNRDELAGGLLAFSTIKPHIVLLPIVFMLIWTFAHKRFKVFLWLIISLIILSVIAAFFVPDWPIQNLREVLRYTAYNPPVTPGAVFNLWLPATGTRLGYLMSVLLAIILVVEWATAHSREFRWFLWTVSLTLVVSQWIGIPTDPGNFIILMLPLVLVFSVWTERWRRTGQVMSVITLIMLAGGLWLLFLNTLIHDGQPIQNPVMFFPLPLFLLVCLYWVRWWAIKPPKLLIEDLQEFESQP